MVVALCWVAWRAPTYGLARRRIIGCVWSCAGGALLAGRVGHVAWHAAYFAQRPGDMLAWRRIGGLSGETALLGGAVAAGLWTWAMRARWRDVAALLTPGTLCIAAAGWWSCWAWGCAWGREVTATPAIGRWLVAELPDLYRTIAPRYAVQVLGGVWALLLMLLSARFPALAAATLAAYSLGSAALTPLRGDLAPVWAGLRADVWLQLALGCGWMVMAWRGYRECSPTYRGEAAL